MINTKNLTGTIAAFLMLCAGVFSASAVPLAPGQLTNAVAEPDPVGATLLFQTNKTFVSDSFTGTLYSSVYSGDLNNTLGGLTFTYYFTIDLGSPDSAKDITLGSLAGGFSGYLTDVSYLAGLGLAPSSVSRSPVLSGNGRNVTFNFDGSGYVQPGQTTDVLVVQTSANGWAIGNASIQDNVSVPNITTLIPISVPEPTSFALFSFGIFGIAGLVHQKRLNRKNRKQVSLPHPLREL